MTHSYSPDYQAMGDCRVCGNQPENCTGTRGPTPHYCKHCTRTFLIRIPREYTGDALIRCSCGWLHPRQIEAGTAVSCDPPRGKPITIEEIKS